MIPTGVIFAVLDCDADSIEQWNRWYDLEHVPPNVWLEGVMLGRRYVAPPELHELRIVDPSSAFAAGRGTFITIYTLCQEPVATVTAMSTLRDKLYAEGRMRFPADKKATRDGDAMTLVAATSDADLALPSHEVPFLGHTGLLVVQRRCPPSVADWYTSDWARAVVGAEGVHGVITLRSSRQEDQFTDLVLLEGDPGERTLAIRAAAPHHDGATVLADAPFLLIDPLRYPWAESIRRSSLPATIG